MPRGWMYILQCANGAYYTGSTNNLTLRIQQHQNGEGANFTKKNLPVQLVYYEEYPRIDRAFYREKQVQGWSRKKKESLINGFVDRLHDLAECRNDSHFKNAPFDSAQGAASDSDNSAPLNKGQQGTIEVTDEASRPLSEAETDEASRPLSEAETDDSDN